MNQTELADHLAHCRSCGAAIVWATSSATGAAMPINYRPDPLGNTLLSTRGGQLYAGVLTRSQASGARADGQVLHASHFTDCPNAAGHRRRRR